MLAIGYIIYINIRWMYRADYMVDLIKPQKRRKGQRADGSFFIRDRYHDMTIMDGWKFMGKY